MSCQSPIPDCLPCNDCPPQGVSYVLPDCPQGEKCEDLQQADCLVYKGPNLPALNILNNDRLITILTKLHKIVNHLGSGSPLVVQSYTATATPPTGSTTPLEITYLGLGPVYLSTPGATSSGAAITVGSTTGLSVGMTVEVISGIGGFAANTVVTAINSATSFNTNVVPSTPLSGGQTIVRAVGTSHQIFNLTVQKNAPQTFKAFPGSVVIISGQGTVV